MASLIKSECKHCMHPLVLLRVFDLSSSEGLCAEDPDYLLALNDS